MVTHHGNLIELAIKRSSFSVSEVAVNLNVHRRTLYNWFTKPELSIEIINKIGIILKHDFGLGSPVFALNKMAAAKPDFKPTELPKQAEDYKQKYLDLLEAYNKLLEFELAHVKNNVHMHSNLEMSY